MLKASYFHWNSDFSFSYIMSNCRFFCQSLSVCKYHGYIEAAMSIIILCSLRSHLYTRSIGSFYSGFQARRALRALKGLMRLKMLIQGQSVKRQATNTLRAMQTLARVQSQIHARRIRMSEENQALQRQLQQRREKELQKLKDAVSVLIHTFYHQVHYFCESIYVPMCACACVPFCN